ncbi:MAG: threonine--tRNA ligase [Nitrospinae bacterium RIFCSPLOWO2_02_FULL_39_110]|nr:MAG: threonine--tRNA ligase [Nitrospinae bacterium RIFCSPHIGHO2_02_39_11]OGV98786.1 MAG: threonine--tRNA ligase [Nitrospinae bacterium RIFCSPHIGHO2_12_FULL_39_42]OGV99903.1 MAG: threonine--tRNA ligase [Nitrospinae bacterium RIFCSPHIGHO2_02_FULL_39_82]OGW04146.1 MAG: threonine--tRNA ligase [Nitrospinae bacterium RIFCSPLOWO2_02_FULL_39_110]OGW06483.1 MAG: threonine--tRNA ligase [Nitrospinae bacterium RIFCSPLOWO2_02_39_17]OGW09160.1 MAG: threonine--tRNA ligase [Nitrospinae bacterium RIFCSPLOWO
MSEANNHNELEILRHSTAHIMAQAVRELYPETKITIGPAIKDGFYYDFDRDTPFSVEDLEKIEKKMEDIIRKDLSFERMEVSKDEARKIFKDEGYKIELINEIQDEKVSVYKQGDFIDLCRGPHLTSTGRVKAFKLISVAGSYWRGNEKNKMLQRIYGTSFFAKKELEEHLHKLEEAKKRDHRRLGKELDLFSMDDEIGAGLINWHPKGSVIRYTIENFWREEHYKNGYQIVYSPHIAKVNLWHTSGHMDFYRENMYSPMDIEGMPYIVKPMNCPFHIKMYKNKLKSYRELPIRWAELGTVYRYERSGVLHGLLRVRGFTQDDAHIFCRLDQLNDEIERVLNFTLYMLKSFGFNDFDVYLSTMPQGYVGTISNWEKATDALKGALNKAGLKFEIDPGAGVFYGPKIDVKIKDSLDRTWQCSTIQVDFNLPERFDVKYIGEDGASHQPIMIHRALLGSLERFFGCLIEHYAGAFPLWLAPVQARVMTITDKQNDFASRVLNQLLNSGIRGEADLRNEKIGFKIREAQMEKIPYMLIVGNKEVESKTVSVRKRGGADMGAIGVEKFVEMIKEEIRSKQ